MHACPHGICALNGKQREERKRFCLDKKTSQLKICLLKSRGNVVVFLRCYVYMDKMFNSRVLLIMQKLARTKVADKFSFPLELDVGRFVGDTNASSSSSSDLFDLMAILIHKGGNATSGHYGMACHYFVGDNVAFLCLHILCIYQKKPVMPFHIPPCMHCTQE